MYTQIPVLAIILDSRANQITLLSIIIKSMLLILFKFLELWFQTVISGGIKFENNFLVSINVNPHNIINELQVLTVKFNSCLPLLK